MSTTYWITGIPGAGKTTLSYRVVSCCLEAGIHPPVVLDGDSWREARPGGGDYTLEGRKNNVRELAEFAQRLNKLGYNALVPTVSPQREVRQVAADIIDNYFEVFLDCPERLGRERQPHLYAKAEQGIFTNYPVVHTLYEPPEQPDLYLPASRYPSDLVDLFIRATKIMVHDSVASVG